MSVTWSLILVGDVVDVYLPVPVLAPSVLAAHINVHGLQVAEPLQLQQLPRNGNLSLRQLQENGSWLELSAYNDIIGKFINIFN